MKVARRSLGLLSRRFPQIRQQSTLQQISLARLEQGCPNEQARFKKVCAHDGFMYIVDHGVENCIFSNCLSAAGRFFALPPSDKAAVHFSRTKVYPGTLGLPVRGYVGVQEERLGPYPGDAPESKEAFDWSAEKPPHGDQTPFHGPNLWPHQLPDEEFRVPLESFRDHLLNVARRFLCQISLAQGMQVDALDEKFSDPTLVCRVLRYPAGTSQMSTGCNPHTDNGFFTLLHQDEVGGLQVKLRGEEWVDVEPVPGALVVNIGDALAAYSGGTWRSTLHRVMSNSSRPRMSAAMFVDPNADEKVLPKHVLPFCNSPNDALKILLHKTGLKDDPADVLKLHDMHFAEYKLRVFSKFLPQSAPYQDFTDAKS